MTCGFLGVPAVELQAAAQLMYYGGDLADLLLAVCLFAERVRERARVSGRLSGA